MTKVRLTQRLVSDIELPKSGRVMHADSEVSGLSIQVSHTGVKAWYWYGRVRGRPTRICLGRFPEVGVEAARRSAKQIVAKVATGELPSPSRRSLQTEITLGQVFNHWMAHYSRPHKRTWRTDEKRFARVLEQWSHRGLSQISKAEVLRHHVEIGDSAGIYAANKMLELLTSLYRHAVEKMDWIGKSPTLGIQRFETIERERFLSGEELRRFCEAIPKLRTTIAKDFFWLCLLTGARRSNVQAMRWDEIDLQREVWTIPKGKSKSKKTIVVPLGKHAIELLREIRQRNQSAFVLPGRGKDGHYCCPKDAWRRVLELAGLSDVRIHDLRRTFGSYQAMSGASLLVISKSLGQTSTAATGIYARLQVDPIRQSVDIATEKMMSDAKES